MPNTIRPIGPIRSLFMPKTSEIARFVRDRDRAPWPCRAANCTNGAADTCHVCGVMLCPVHLTKTVDGLICKPCLAAYLDKRYGR